jgi:hypothetical protein
MVLVAIVAVVLHTSALLLRPYPMVGIYSAGYSVFWSDGSSTFYRSLEDFPIAYIRHVGPIVRVDWKDGSASLHWRNTPKRHRPARPHDPPLAIPEVKQVTY